MFILLYPIGVQGELNIVWHAMMALRKYAIRRSLSIVLPNRLNFSVDYLYAIRICSLAYLYFPVMYAHMVNRRRTVLGLSINSQDTSADVSSDGNFLSANMGAPLKDVHSFVVFDSKTPPHPAFLNRRKRPRTVQNSLPRRRYSDECILRATSSSDEISSTSSSDAGDMMMPDGTVNGPSCIDEEMK